MKIYTAEVKGYLLKTFVRQLSILFWFIIFPSGRVTFAFLTNLIPLNMEFTLVDVSLHIALLECKGVSMARNTYTKSHYVIHPSCLQNPMNSWRWIQQSNMQLDILRTYLLGIQTSALSCQLIKLTFFQYVLAPI